MHFDTATRQRWMSVLAHSEPQELLARMQTLQLAPDYELIRAPETGLVQLQARMGGIGDRFFAGDATLTRAAIRLADGTLGYSWIWAATAARRTLRGHRRPDAVAPPFSHLNGNPDNPAGSATQRAH
jgi:alpha-D-ribose 1-methylphosphonate 5-triphosphate synthase subunit PhnG